MPPRPRLDSARPRTLRREHPLEWLAEPLRDDPGFELKAFFGGRTVMLDGLHRLFLTAQGEPWQGVLVCTSREHHGALLAEFPDLLPHPVLGKWLYLPERSPAFETTARQLVALARDRDPRLGVAPSAKKRRSPAKRIRFGDPL